jgi:hypothetical protein
MSITFSIVMEVAGFWMIRKMLFRLRRRQQIILVGPTAQTPAPLH